MFYGFHFSPTFLIFLLYFIINSLGLLVFSILFIGSTHPGNFKKSFLDFANKKRKIISFDMTYNAGVTPGPIGRPIKYHTTTRTIHVIDISMKYGDINCKAPLMVYGLFFCRLYIFRYPI